MDTGSSTGEVITQGEGLPRGMTWGLAVPSLQDSNSELKT